MAREPAPSGCRCCVNDGCCSGGGYPNGTALGCPCFSVAIVFNNPRASSSPDSYGIECDGSLFGGSGTLVDNLPNDGLPRVYYLGSICGTVIANLQTLYGSDHVAVSVEPFEDISTEALLNHSNVCTISLFQSDGGAALAGITAYVYKQIPDCAPCSLIKTHVFPDNGGDGTQWYIDIGGSGANSCCCCNSFCCDCEDYLATITNITWTYSGSVVGSDPGPYYLHPSTIAPSGYCCQSQSPITIDPSTGNITSDESVNVPVSIVIGSTTYAGINMNICCFTRQCLCGFPEQILAWTYVTGGSGFDFGPFNSANDSHGYDWNTWNSGGGLTQGASYIDGCSTIKIHMASSYFFCPDQSHEIEIDYDITLTCLDGSSSSGFGMVEPDVMAEIAASRGASPKEATDAKRQTRAERLARSRKAGCGSCGKLPPITRI